MSSLVLSLESFLDKHRRIVLPAGICSGIFTALFLLLAMQAWNPFSVITFWAFSFFCTLKAFAAPFRKKEGLPCGLLSAAFCFCIQAQLVVSGSLTFGLFFWALFLLFSATAFFVCLGLCHLLVGAQLPYSAAPKSALWKQLALYTGIILVCWMPVFLCWGPVRLDVDSVQLLEQAFHGGLNDAHPVFYTLLLRFIIGPFYSLGITEIGAYLFGFLQMTAMAGILAYSLVWMRNRGSGLLPVILGFGLFCGTTAYAFHSLVLWKDPLFNGVLLLYSLFLYDTAACRGKNLQNKASRLHFVLLNLLLCFLRGNGWPIALLACCLLLLFTECRKTIFKIFLPLLVLVKLITGPGYAALGIQSTLTAEAWAIPLQQLGYVAANCPEDFSEQQQETLAKVIPLEQLAESYSPPTVDPIKSCWAFDADHFSTLQGKIDLLSVWLQLMPSHMTEYTKAWFMETAMYTNPRFNAGTYSFPHEGSNGSFGITSKDIVAYFTGWTGLRGELESRATFIPPALLAFGLVLCSIVQLVRGRGHLLIAYLPMYLVWVGMLLGAPAYAEFRYMLVFALAIPFALFTLVAAPQEQKY